MSRVPTTAAAAAAAEPAAAKAASRSYLLPWQHPSCVFVSDSDTDPSLDSSATVSPAAAAAAAAAAKQEAAKSYLMKQKQHNAKVLAVSPPGKPLSPVQRPPLTVLLRCLVVIWSKQKP